MKLERSFYLNPDVVAVARSLLGKYLYTNFEGKFCGGMITETEAYRGVTDRASHAYGNRRTPRTEVMYQEGGLAYVYLCYGIHSLFNVVTNGKDSPHAVLVRGMVPEFGLDHMTERLNKKSITAKNTNGPGKLTKALGIHFSHTGLNLRGDRIWIEDRGILIEDDKITTGSRIGVDYAKEDASLPYRFVLQSF
ncbi:MAG: DNA-3-methyladenine glycosylase [Bacteroidales bacterium]|nr:DNA-3-methyladenine glycosylase [Bacteroidales bacterium]MCF8396961.1 DNA-3-methyladenine glycosylase [Bacteroidales bacterium]